MYYITYQYFYRATPPSPRACIHGYLHYSGRGRGRPANHPPPPEYLLTQHSCKETSPPCLHTTTHNNTQQHITTHNNSTWVHKTNNVPVVFMALILNGFEGCNIITRGIGTTTGTWIVILTYTSGIGIANRRFNVGAVTVHDALWIKLIILWIHCEFTKGALLKECCHFSNMIVVVD